jgi:hypothetical protein
MAFKNVTDIPDNVHAVTWLSARVRSCLRSSSLTTESAARNWSSTSGDSRVGVICLGGKGQYGGVGQLRVFNDDNQVHRNVYDGEAHG